MIVVSGTKRSGTSLWMQILQAAGLQAVGEAFSRDWADTIRDANPGGFHESLLRRGIYFETNPHPRTGRYLSPEQSRHWAVKVFIPGLVRSDVAFLDRVIATVRPWREYSLSIARLSHMERHAKREKHGEDKVDFAPTPLPWVEWWTENFELLRDSLTRAYPCRLISYDRLLRQPETTVQSVLEWIAVPPATGTEAMSQAERCRRAASVVTPTLRTQHADVAKVAFNPPQACVAVFDELYAYIDADTPLSEAFVHTLNQTQERLEPRLAQERQQLRQAHRQWRQRRLQRSQETQQ